MEKYNFYHFIYYKLYKFAIRTEKKWGQEMQMPEWAAFILMALLFFLNVLLIVIISVKLDFKISNWQIVLPILLIIALNFFLFIYKQKYISIELAFDQIESKKRWANNAFFWIYIVITIIAVIFCLLFIKPNMSIA